MPSRSYHPLTRLALVQCTVVMIGLAIMALVFKQGDFMGPNPPWNPLSLAVNRIGLFWLLVPLAWAVTSFYLEERPTGFWTLRWTLGSGVLVGLALGLLFGYAALNPFRGVMPIMAEG